MTSLRALLAFNMKEKRRIIGLSQAKLAAKVNTSTHYIGMIETKKKFPSPEMLERIAAALEIDSPQLFSMAGVSWENMRKFQTLILSDVEKAFVSRMQNFGDGTLLA
jgi:transcriptional regulator with XRE-family HTH domain